MKVNFWTWKSCLVAALILTILFVCLNICRDSGCDIFLKKPKPGEDLPEDEEYAPVDIYKEFEFDEKKAMNKWKNKVFKGKTVYWIDGEGDEKFLHSKSEKTSSALYRLLSYKIKEYPLLGWEWRPVKFPDKSAVVDPKLKDDYALRVYVIFASGFFTNFRCVEYVWDESLPVGRKIVSPYSEKIMQIVIRSGQGSGEWVAEKRNVQKDYIDLFGEEPKLGVRGIAVMSDSEGSEDASEANFRDIKIMRKKQKR